MQQRLYAFLLKRLLGPLLDEDSLDKLHRSIEVSLQEGRFALTKVRLNARSIHERLDQHDIPVNIRSALVDKLEIKLSLVETEFSSSRQTSSLTWRAMQMIHAGSSAATSEGSAEAKPLVHLFCEVVLDGLCIELEPADMKEYGDAAAEDVGGAAATATGGYLSRYMDAIMASLRLSVQLNNISLRFISPRDEMGAVWLQCSVQRLLYHDMLGQTSCASESSDTTILHKALDLVQLSLVIGQNAWEAQCVHKMAADICDPQSTGTGSCIRRIPIVRIAGAQLQVQGTESRRDTQFTQIRNDIRLTFLRKMDVCLCADVFVLVKQLIETLPARTKWDRNQMPTPLAEEVDVPGELTNEFEDEKAVSILKKFAQQYDEARMLVGQNCFRGGMLVPAEETAEDHDGIAFDTFFDANETGIGHFSSVLMESLALSREANGNAKISMTTDLRLAVPEGNVKLLFLKPDDLQQVGKCDDYLVLTLSDLSIAASLSKNKGELSVSILYLDVEHSHVPKYYHEDGCLLEGGLAEMNHVLRFRSGCNETLVQAPCLSIVVAIDELTDVELMAEPLELTFHPEATEDLLIFSQSVLMSMRGSTVRGIQVPFDTGASNERPLSIYAACPSLSLVLPIPDFCDNPSLFQRCGYASDTPLSRQGAMGFQICGAVYQSGGVDHDFALCFTADAVHSFVSAPSELGTLRFDILSLAGYDDVQMTPSLSFKLWKPGNGNTQMESRLSQSFPRVPVVSSFKARQLDDDEDNRIDRVLYSDIEGTNIGTRSDLRRADHQSEMINAALKSNFLLEVDVPECAVDLTTSELSILVDTVKRACAIADIRRFPDADNAGDAEISKAASFSMAFRCDFVSLAFHASNPESLGDLSLNSVLLNFSKLEVHYVQLLGSFHHLRCLADEVDAFEATSCLYDDFMKRSSQSPLGRCRLFAHGSSGSVEPFIHRSHLFEPISRQSPAVVLDLVNNSAGRRHQLNLYVTVYDTTIRWNRDKTRLQSVLDNLRKSEPLTNVPEPERAGLTRVFLALADCNVDYSSASEFKTESRMILRIGDLRISSNLVSPAPPKQACSISVGDGALYICKQRFPYYFENSRIPRAGVFLFPHQTDLSLIGCDGKVASTKVLELMDYLTIATLDSFDAVIAAACAQPQTNVDAQIQANLTVGELCVYACKDSFTKLLATLSELSNELTAINTPALEALKDYSYPDLPATSTNDHQVECGSVSHDKSMTLVHKRKHMIGKKDFLLDGYDWTTIDQEVSEPNNQAGDEQTARWYDGCENDSGIPATSRGTTLKAFRTGEPHSYPTRRGPCIMFDHFPLQTVSDPLHDVADMGIAKLLGISASPRISTRLLVHDLRLKIRFFDGFDWPDLLDARQRLLGAKGFFIIDESACLTAEDEIALSVDSRSQPSDVKSQLMGDLLDGELKKPSDIFKSIPLPEERAAQLREQAERRRLSRKTAKYFQFAVAGVSIRLDSLVRASDHRLASCMNVKIQDFFAAETISSDRPVKMAGEWLSDAEHPRKTVEGLFSMKLVTWHPRLRVTPDNVVNSDESEAIIKLLPLRCILDQRAIRFIRIFIRQDTDVDDDDRAVGSNDQPTEPRYWVPPPLFTSVLFKAFKLKIDYRPEKLDTDALRNGSIVELINLSPIDNMVLALQQVEVSQSIGFGDVLSVAVGRWIDDVCSTQLLKFLTNSRPLEPFKSVSQGAADMIVLPWEAIQNGDSVKRALRAGVKSFSDAIFYETFTLTSRATEYIADQVSKLSVSGIGSNALPSRPLRAPRGVLDTAPHVVESITRGLQAANYKLVVVPYREYRRSGTRGAVTSALRGIPVAIAAPASGAVEAISYGMIGARNQFSPEVRKEEEAHQRGLHWDG